MILAALLAGPAAAQDLPQADPEAVRACLDAGGAGCIGAAAASCQTRPMGDSTIGIISCLQSEHQAWDDLMNAQYKGARARLLAQGGPELADRLLEAQRDWIAFRDADCTLVYDLGQGTERGILASQCMLDKTARRALELRDLGAAP